MVTKSCCIIWFDPSVVQEVGDDECVVDDEASPLGQVAPHGDLPKSEVIFTVYFLHAPRYARHFQILNIIYERFPTRGEARILKRQGLLLFAAAGLEKGRGVAIP